MIAYSRQDITQFDVDEVIKVLRSDMLTQGAVVPAFEQAVALHIDVKHALAVNSATSALHLACLALGLGVGDRLWTVPNTFVASANCGRYCGAEVDFVDIDPLTWNMSIAQLEEKLIVAKKKNKLPKIVVPVHFSGQATEQQAIWKLAQEYGFKVIEDASHSIGATRNDEFVGSCRWSDLTVFSFHPVKIITTGEGGMVCCNDDQLAEHIAMLRSHGITRDLVKFKGSHDDNPYHTTYVPWYYEQQLLGFNYRMTDIQAALGLSQLARLDGYIERRNQLAERYNNALKDLPIQLPTVQSENRSSFHLFVIRLKLNAIARTHQQVFESLRQKDIGVNVHYMPVHLQPYYRELGFKAGQYPEAENHGREAITLPLYPALTDQEQDYVIDTLKGIL